jgi:hypothetical protein
VSRTRALLVVPLLVVLVGCSGGHDAGSDVSTAAGEALAVDQSGGKAAVGGTGGSTGGSTTSARVTPVERSVVRTASLVVEVDDVPTSAAEARGLATGAGGELTGEQSSTGGEDARAVLTLRVPGERLDATLTRLARLGQERDREVTTEDVTEQVVDLDARIATQRASVARVRALLDRATGLGDVVKVEGEVAKREAELESLLSRIRAVEGRAEMATVTLTLLGDGAEPVDGSEQVGFTGGLERGWDAFTTTFTALAAATGALLPFLPLLALGLLAHRRWGRRDAVRAAVVPEGGSRA